MKHRLFSYVAKALTGRGAFTLGLAALTLFCVDPWISSGKTRPLPKINALISQLNEPFHISGIKSERGGLVRIVREDPATGKLIEQTLSIISIESPSCKGELSAVDKTLESSLRIVCKAGVAAITLANDGNNTVEDIEMWSTDGLPKQGGEEYLHIMRGVEGETNAWVEEGGKKRKRDDDYGQDRNVGLKRDQEMTNRILKSVLEAGFKKYKR